MNSKDINQEDLEKLLDNKLIIGVKENVRKVLSTILWILFFLMALIFIGLLVVEPINSIPIFIMSVIILLVLDYTNKKIIIENLKISKTSLFTKKKEIGNMSEITSISNDIYRILVLKNNEKFFSFNIYGRDDNLQLYNYLTSRYNESIRINEFIKKFQIVDDKIIYKKLFASKKFNISDLTRIEYKKTYYRRNLYNLHTIVGYINNKKVFKVQRFTPGKIELLKEIIKKYNSECKVIKKN